MFAKKLLLFCIFLSLFPFVFAADGGVVGQNTYVSYEFITGSGLTDADNITLHLYNPNGSNVVSNQNMTYLQTGLYNYNFTPTAKGNHLVIFDLYFMGAFVGTETRSIYVTENEETNNMILAITLAILGLGFLAAYISHNIKLEEIPTGRIVEKALYYAISFAFLLGTPIFLLILAENNPALNYLEGFLNTSVVVTTLCGLGILIFYFIYHMRKRLERIAKIQEEVENDLEE